MSFSDKLKQELEANKGMNESSSGGWFKFKEGANTFRVLVEPVMMFEKFNVGICYTDCGYQGTPRLLTRILDRADGKVKIAKLPFSIGEQLLNLENDADYGYTGFPMPYDVTIKAEGAGTKEVKYSAPLPRPPKALESEITDELAKGKSVAEVIEKMKANQKEKHMADGTWAKNQAAKEATKKEIADSRVEGGGKKVDAIEYPTEDINPDDIPF